MMALLDFRRTGLLSRQTLLRDLVSGTVVGLVALPLALAFAIASGARPEQGLYTSIIAGFIVAVCGGSRFQIAGPTGAFVVILAGITAKYGIDGLQIATLMAGGILLLLGMARLGSIIKFIPSPVIVGFTSGIGVIIFVGQWKDFFGLPPVAGEYFHEKLLKLLFALPQLHPATTLLALASLIITLTAPRFIKLVPGPLVAIVVGTALQAGLQFQGVATIGSAFGELPHGLPGFHIPEITMSRVIQLIGPAFAIAMLGAIESLLSAVVADGMAGTRHDSNQELIGQGLANIVVPMLGGFAATGAIARTATNIRSGATSPVSGIVHSSVLLMVILFFAPLASAIPLCTLAAILFVVAYNMSDMRRFAGMVKQAPRHDVAILLITFALTIFVDLVVAVNVGVILAALIFMQRMSQAVQVEQHTHERVYEDIGEEIHLPKEVIVYSIEGPFFFGAAEVFEHTIALIHGDPKVLILRLGHVPFVDITGIETLKEVIEEFKQRGIRVIYCEATRRVHAKLDKSGVSALVGGTNIFATLEDAARSAAPRPAV